MVILEHAQTQRNLRVDTARAMLSGNAEVSCLNRDGGDSGDNFVVECEKQEKGSIVTGATTFYLRHEKLNSYLYTSKYNNFHEGNCGSRCPIIGQLEVSGVSSRNANGRWKVDGGVFVEERWEEDAAGARDQPWVVEEADAPQDTDL